MVKKSCKFGVSSGNTIRASSNTHARLNGHKACLIHQLNEYQVKQPSPTKHKRRSHNRQSVVSVSTLGDELEDWDVHKSNVIYSLNKKARWELPELLKGRIHSDERYNEDFKISLLEHHYLNRQANCVSYHASKGDNYILTPKKGYFDEKSINCKKSTDSAKGSKRKSHKQSSGKPESREVEEEMPAAEIAFEVFYPSPNTSYATHNQKYQAKSRIELLSQRRGNVGTKRRTKLTTTDYLNTHVFDDLYYEMIDEDNDWACDNKCEINHSSGEVEISEKQITFQDVFDQALETKPKGFGHAEPKSKSEYKRSGCRLSSNESDTKQAKVGKGCAIYVNQPFPAINKNKHKSGRRKRKRQRHRKTAVVKPPVIQRVCEFPVSDACVLIPSGCVCMDSLKQEFCGKYFEALSKPRKFCLDITSELSEMIRKKHFGFRKEEIWSWVIFAYEGQYGQGLQMFRVYLNTKLDKDQLFVQTLQKMEIYSVKDICLGALEFLKGHAAAVYLDNPNTLCASASSFELLGSMMGWKHESYHSTVSYKFAFWASVKSFAVTDDIDTTVSRPEMCNICFAPIEPSEACHHMTRLQLCGHWICNMCLTEHLFSMLKMGSLTLQCPEFNCKAEIDPATVLSLSPASDYKLFLYRCHDSMIQRHAQKKWCPNPTCGRVIVSQEKSICDQGMFITCACGINWCFNCLQEAHWPATCQQAKEHKERVISLGDEGELLEDNVLPEVIVPIKYCPKCKEALNKDGGCPCVVCLCGYLFCWSCLGDWHEDGEVCEKFAIKEKVNTIKKRFVKEKKELERNRQRSQFYCLAVIHNQKRRRRHKKKLCKGGQQIKIILKAQEAKTAGNSGSQIPGTDSTVTSDDLINKIINIIPQMHFLLEHTAVLMEYGSVGVYQKHIHQLLLRKDFICIRFEQILEENFKFEAIKIADFIRRLQRLLSHAVECIEILTGTIKHVIRK